MLRTLHIPQLSRLNIASLPITSLVIKVARKRRNRTAYDDAREELDARKDEDKSAEPPLQEDEDVYPPKKVVIPAFLALALSFFVVALDRTILGTAIPAITNDFNSFGDVAWYEAAFLLPLCALQLSFGKIYTYYSGKLILLILVTIFEIGSIVSATAPNSHALIIGRAITGIGAAGLSSGAIITVNTLIPLRSRPKYLGSFGAIFGIASIVGPLLGGYLTAVSWRWCFWINVPIGGISLIVLIFLLPKAPPPSKPADTLRGKLNQLDPIGFVLVSTSTVCILFALQWGGVRYPWGNWRIVLLFLMFGVFILGFIGVQAWRKEKATVPPSIFFQRTVLAGCVASIGIGTLLVVFAYYLPLWFQAIQGKSPQSSGLSLIALLLSNVVFVIAGGLITSQIGYYTPTLITGAAVAIVGSALISTWQVHTSRGQWIGYQVILGAGLGLTLQAPNIAVQTVLSKHQVPIGISLLGFIQFFGSTIFVTVCQSLLQTRLIAGLDGKIPNFDATTLTQQGATSIRTLVAPEYLPLVLEVYNEAMKGIWYVGVGMSGLALVASLGFEWRSVRGEKRMEVDDVKAEEGGSGEKKEAVDVQA